MTDAAPNALAIAIAQLNPIVGDIEGNCKKILKARAQAAQEGADLIVFSELFITGYSPEDLVLKPAFQDANWHALEALAQETNDGGPAILTGTLWRDNGKLYNAIALLEAGKIQTLRAKVDLPNYGVFDEKRVFEPGPMPGPINFRGCRLGVPICEDIWNEEVCECLAETGAELLIVPNGSPYWQGKHDIRMNVAVARVAETGLPMIYVNQVGGQDELVFDGGSFCLNGDNTLRLQMPAWQEAVVLSRWRREGAGAPWQCEQSELSLIEEGDEAVYTACVLGLRDYVQKNKFPGVVLGLSGGIDSALCAAMAVDALGADKVHCVMLPYHYTSEESLSDAKACAEALGVRYDIMPIYQPVEGFMKSLTPLFEGQEEDTTEENLQSRTRGTLLMALSNKFGTMVITTGNKSEVSVGYATLYGDMNGGFNPIKDVYKTQVYALSRFRNENRPVNCLGPTGEIIPTNIITKEPTAELKEDQRDQDSLPPYDVLDDILDCLVEQEMPLEDIMARGHDKALVQRIAHLLAIAEYKRRQSAPGVKITERNFGRDRRYPITNHFREK